MKNKYIPQYPSYGKSKYIKFKYLYFSNLFNYFCSHIRDVQMVFNLWEDAMNF